MPILVGILWKKDISHYTIYFDHLFDHVFQTVKKEKMSMHDFLTKFPGNVSDMSDAIREAYFESLKKHLEVNFPEEEVPDVDYLYGFCKIHFRRNLDRLCRNKEYIPTDDNSNEFKTIMLELVNNVYNLDEFKAKVSFLIQKYPKVHNWIHWYLNARRAKILFPSLKMNYSFTEYSNIVDMPDNTNAIENMGK